MNLIGTMSNSSSVSIGKFNSEEGVTGELSTFMDQVESYMTFKIAYYINQYWFPIVAPIGLVGNTLSFLVMIQPNNRKMSTYIYMASCLIYCVISTPSSVSTASVEEVLLGDTKSCLPFSSSLVVYRVGVDLVFLTAGVR